MRTGSSVSAVEPLWINAAVSRLLEPPGSGAGAGHSSSHSQHCLRVTAKAEELEIDPSAGLLSELFQSLHNHIFYY